MAENFTTSYDNTSATISNNIKSKDGYPYPAVHQFGSDKIPARPFMPFTQNNEIPKDLKDEILDIITQHFLR